MSQDPNKVIVYRSVAEQQRDEFWWSEGYLTPTMTGDALLVMATLFLALYFGGTIYERLRYSHKNKRHLLIAGSVAGVLVLVGSLVWCFNHLHITVR